MSKLKTEILELGGDPIKKGNPFKADQKYRRASRTIKSDY